MTAPPTQPDWSPTRVTICGTGAMGCLFGRRLATVADVTLVGAWAEGIHAIQRHGIHLEGEPAEPRARVSAVTLGSEIEPADLVLVLAKTWQTERIARHIPSLLKPCGVILTLQNGLGNMELLGPQACPGTTAEGATLIGPGSVRRGGRGPTYAAAPDWVAGLLRRAGFDAHKCEAAQAESLLWGKLAANCGINALTALLRVPNGRIAEQAEAAILMERAAMECAAVARARGIQLPFADPAAHVREVARRTAGNFSSMLQDILRGAPTECDAINGAVVREGRRLGIPTPVNDILWHLIRAEAALISDRSESTLCK